MLFAPSPSIMCPGANRKHRQDRQRSQPKSLIVDRRPRQNHQHGKRAQGHPEPLHSESWCTGEDSNLRSPLGAADLQSAAINHSATCAQTAEPTGRPASPVPLSKSRLPGALQFHRQHSATAAQYGFRAKSFLGSCCCGQFSRRVLRPAWLASLLRRVARSRFQIWSWRRDLNPRPSDYKSDALPAELRQRAAQFGPLPQSSIVLRASRDKH